MQRQGEAPVAQRFVARKHHKLRGQYLRVFGVGPGGFVNEDPAAHGAVTNRWAFRQLVDILVPQAEQAGGREGELEFRLVIEEESAFGATRSTLAFSSPCRAELLCALRANKLVGKHGVQPASKLRRVDQRERPCLLVAGEAGLAEVSSAEAPRVLRTYRYVDMFSVQPSSLDGVDSGFVVLVGREKRPHAFCGPGTGAVLAAMQSSCKASGIELLAVEGQLDSRAWKALCQQYERQADIGAPLAEFEVRKRKSGAAVRLRVTSTHLVEEEARSGGAVLSVRGLGRLRAAVRPLDDPTHLDLDFHSDDKTAEYSCDQRDALLAHVMDACARRGVAPALYCARPRPALRLLPPRCSVPPEVELLHLRRLLGVLAHNATELRGRPPSPTSDNEQMQRLVLASTALLENSNARLQAATFSGLSANTELYGAGTVGLVSAACAAVSRRSDAVVKTACTLLDAVLRIVDCADSRGHFSADNVPELVALASQAIEPRAHVMLRVRGLRLLLALFGGPVADALRCRTTEQANKQLFLGGARGAELARALGALLVECAEEPLLCGPLAAVLEAVLVSGRDSTSPEVYNAVLLELAERPAALLEPFALRIAGASDDMALVIFAVLQDAGPETAAALHHEALRTGAFLRHLYEAFFGASGESRATHQFLVQLWLHDHNEGHALLRRVVPAGLYHALSRPALTTRARERMQSDRQAPQGADRMLERVARAKAMFAQGVAPGTLAPNEQQPSERGPGPTFGAGAAAGAGMPSNFELLFLMAEQDHVLPDLLWGPRTRSELRQALEAERSALDAESGARWNYEEFSVDYKSLATEYCVGGCYIRLLVDPPPAAAAAEAGAPSFVEQVHDPDAFFKTLYQQYLREVAMQNRTRAGQCLKAMACVHSQHAGSIRAFEDMAYLLESARRSTSLEVRDQILGLVAALTESRGNCVRLARSVESWLPVLLAALHDALSPAQDEREQAQEEAEPQWYYRRTGALGDKLGPLTRAGLRALLEGKSHEWVADEMECWAAGMSSWLPLMDVAPLYWACCARGESGDHPRAEASAALHSLRIFHRLVCLHGLKDAQGRPLRPLPKALRLFGQAGNLAPVVHCLLSSEPAVVEEAAQLLVALVRANEAVVPALSEMGVFLFALQVDGPHFGSAAVLLHEALAFGEQGAAPVLAELLPECMVGLLQRHGPGRFTEVFAGSCSNPEVIWTDRMREQLALAIREHLGEFTERLRENPFLRYSQLPLPGLCLENLEDLAGELWCGGFFLRNLCDKERFPDWPVPDPAALLRAAQDAAEALAVPQSDREAQRSAETAAREVLELAPDATPADARAAFRVKARATAGTPEALAELAELKSACHVIARTERERSGVGDLEARRALLLRAQSFLFERFPSALRDSTFDTFGPLVSAARAEWRANTGMLAVATDLVYKICLCAPSNADNLVAAGGAELLLELLAEHSDALRASGSWEADAGAAQVVENVLSCLIGLASIASTRERLRCIAETERDKPALGGLCTVLDFYAAPAAMPSVRLALQAVSRMSADAPLQDVLVRMGILWHIVPVLFAFEEADAGNPGNALAKHGARALSRVAGLLSAPELATDEHAAARETLERLLSEPVAALLSHSDPTELLTVLNGARESTTLIWNASLRSDVLAFLERPGGVPWDALVDADGSAASFRLSALEDEPRLGGVYLRVLIAQPEEAPQNAPALALELLAQLKADAGPVRIAGWRDIWLRAFHVLAENAQVADAVANALVLAEPPVFDVLFQLARAAETRAEALAALTRAARANRALCAMVAQEGLVEELLALEVGGDEVLDRVRDPALMGLLEALCGVPRTARFVAAPATLGWLLRAAVLEPCSAPALRVLQQALRDPGLGEQACVALAEALPSGMVRHLRAADAAPPCSVFEQEVDSPELIWDRQMLATLREALQAHPLPTPARVEYARLEGERLVGGVYVHAFLRKPRAALRDPLRFARKLLDALVEELEGKLDIKPDGFASAFHTGAASAVGATGRSADGDAREDFATSNESAVVNHLAAAAPSMADPLSSGFAAADPLAVAAPPPLPARRAPPPPVPRRESKPDLLLKRAASKKPPPPPPPPPPPSAAAGAAAHTAAETAAKAAAPGSAGKENLEPGPGDANEEEPLPLNEEDLSAELADPALGALLRALLLLFREQPAIRDKAASLGHSQRLVMALETALDRSAAATQEATATEAAERVAQAYMHILSAVSESPDWASELARHSHVERVLLRRASPLGAQSSAALTALAALAERSEELAERVEPDAAATLLPALDGAFRAPAERLLRALQAGNNLPVRRLLAESKAWALLTGVS